MRRWLEELLWDLAIVAGGVLAVVLLLEVFTSR